MNAMIDLRKYPRYTSLAQARLSGEDVGEAVLKDMSVTGCRLEFSAPIAPLVGDRFRLLVIPELRSEVEPFELMVETRWNRVAVDAYEVGFAIIASPKGKAFQRYLDYLVYRGLNHHVPMA